MKSPVFLFAALAVTGPGWSRSAFAEPPEPPPLFEVYGTIVPFLEYGHTTGATDPGDVAPGTGASQVAAAGYTGSDAPGRNRLDMGTSNLGFRGGFPLTHNLSVVWQIESGVQTDGGAVNNTIASRNSNIGVTGPWGTLFVGQWDTPFKWSNLMINTIRAGWVADYNGILNGPGFGVQAAVTRSGRNGDKSDAAFERRQGNSVQYWSPTIAGLSARLAYSIDEGRTLTTPMAPSIRPSIFGASLSYERGPIVVRDAFDAHFDYFGMSQLGGSPGDTVTNRSSTDLGNKLLAQYTNRVDGFDTRAIGVFEYLRYKNKDTTPGAFDQYSRSALYGLVEQTLFGKHHVWVGVGHAFQGACEQVGGGACSTEGLGATEGVLGYLYQVSKSTAFLAAGYRIDNNPSASYSTSPGLGGAAAPGATVEAFGVGMIYTFSATIIKGRSAAPAPAEPPPAPPAPPPPPASDPGAKPPAEAPATPPVEPAPAPPAPPHG